MVRKACWWVSVFLATLPAHARDGFVLALDALDTPIEQTMVDVDRAARLGATHFNVPVLLCQENGSANTMHWCGEYKSRLRQLAQALHTRKLTVGIFPFLLANDGTWRGFFEPSDFNTWSSAYLGYLSEVARFAGELGITEFIAGSELNHLYDHAEFWRSTLTKLRGLMPGVSVFIVANWDQYANISFWDASDYIGLSAYYPLANSEAADSSINALTNAWRAWADKLIQISIREKRSLYFSEVGYASMKSAAHEPWRFAPPAPLDLELQERLYEAFANVWAEDAKYSSRLERFMLWALEIVDDPLQDTGFSVLGKPAQKPLSKAFRRRGAMKLRGLLPTN